MRVKGNNEIAKTINNHMGGIRVKIFQIINHLPMPDESFNIHTIKKQLDGNEASQMTLMKLMDDPLKEMKKLQGKDFEKATIIKFTNTYLRLLHFLKYNYKRPDIFLYELNHAFISDFMIYLKSKFANSQITVYKHYQRTVRVLKKAIFQLSMWNII